MTTLVQRTRHVMNTLRVLVIEDDHDSADSLARLLRLAGHEVEVAYSGHIGLLMASRRTPDVVLLDIGLPRLDGYRIAQELRSLDQTKHALIVAVTGYGNDDDILRSKEAGFDLHLVKPISTERLLAVMRERVSVADE